MALPLKEFSAAGVAITDEIVRCDEAVTIGGNAYYKGYLAHNCNGNIAGDTSATYGAWTAASKGGTRRTVLIAGYPTGNTQVAVDLKNGWVYTTDSILLYFRYLAHEPIKHQIDPVVIAVNGLLETGVAATLATLQFPNFVKIGYARIHNQGGLPTAAVTITLSNGTETQTVTMSNTDSDTVAEFTTPFKVTTSQTLTVTVTDGKNAYGFTLTLPDV